MHRALASLIIVVVAPAAAAGTFGYRQVYAFPADVEANVANPIATLLYSRGTFYGVGGTAGTQGVFAISPSGTKQDLLKFSYDDNYFGSFPNGPLVELGGRLYGTAYFGGKINCGVLYFLAPGGTEHLAHSFRNRSGCGPATGLTRVGNTIYGTTEGGGPNKLGVLYSLSHGHVTVLHQFGSGNDGAAPLSPPILVGTTLYGATYGGGSGGLGTIYAYEIGSGNYRSLYSFSYANGGAFPSGNLTYAFGNLYGMTAYGGNDGVGSAFGISLAGALVLNVPFRAHRVGMPSYPSQSGFVVYGNGLYGTSSAGGAYDQGTVFKITLNGDLQILHSFGAPGDGAQPQYALTRVGDTFWGTTPYGGVYGNGTFFTINP